MRSFVPALIAALVTFTSAAPVDLPKNLPVPVPPPGVPPTGNVISGLGTLGGLRARDGKIAGVVKGVEAQVPGHRARTTPPSVALVFDGLLTQIQPYTEQLTYIDSSNATLAQITTTVASIKAPIVAAISELQALVGVDPTAVLAPVGGTIGGAQLTVPQVAATVGVDVNLVLSASGKVLAFVKVNVPGIVDDVQDALSELGDNVTDLVEAVTALVNGLSAELVTVLDPVEDVIDELSLTRLGAILGISIAL